MPRLVIITTCLLALLWLAQPILAADGEKPPAKVVVFVPQNVHYEDKSPFAELFRTNLVNQHHQGVELRAFPEESLNDPQAISLFLVGLANEPAIKAVVIGESPIGCLDGVSRLRAKRPDILIISIDPEEPVEQMGRVATLTMSLNYAARGYIYPIMAQRMGAKKIVYFSFPRYQDMPSINRQYRVMSQAALDLNLDLLVDVDGPDPNQPGYDQATLNDYLEKTVDHYLERLGPNTAFVSSSSNYDNALAPIIMRRGGNLLEAIHPSLTIGFPKALDLAQETIKYFGQWPKLLAEFDEKIIAMDKPVNYATWTYPYPQTAMLAMTDLAVLAVDQQINIYDMDQISTTLNKYSPGIKWQVNAKMDFSSDSVVPQVVLVLQDTYWFGHGYQGFTRLNIPAKYYRIK